MLILISPPQTEHEVAQIWTGNTDTHLTEDGVKIAKALGTLDAKYAFIAPSAHAKEFAKIVVRCECLEVPAFADRSMGKLTGRAYRETMAEFPRRNWLAWNRSYWQSAPEGESFFDISDRVLTAFRTQILPILAFNRVAVIAAPDVLRLIIGHCSKIEEGEVPRIRVESCVPHVVNGDLV